MPNRIIKESICVSDSIDRLTWFEEVLFYRLMVNCDDFGRFDGRISVIKNRLFPLKDNITTKAVTDAINKLVSVELVVLYEYEGKPYLHLPTWNEHQTIRAKKSKYPAPDDSVITSESKCKQMQADVAVIQSESNPNPNPNPKPHTVRWAGLSPRLTEALEGFEDMRKKAKKPMTDKARELAVKELLKLSNNEEEQIAIVEQSIAKCWLSFYPLKAEKAAGSDTSRLVRMINGGAFDD